MLGECCLAPYAYGDALDVLCVRHEDASVSSTDWHVVFERLPRSGTNVVTVRLNGVAVDLGGVSMVVREVLQPAVFTRAVFTRRGTQERAGTPDVEAGGSFRKTGEAEEFAAPPGFELAALVASGALVAGRNEVVYDLGEGITAQAFVYLWHAHTPTVVFDVDGTVTVNDIVGHLGGFTDQPWVHAGICEFACALAARGYAVLFLTARPARGPTGIARTRRFLFEIAGAPRRRPRRPRRHAPTPAAARPPAPPRRAVDRESGYKLPMGPVFTTTHTSTLSALREELGGASRLFKERQLGAIAACFGGGGGRGTGGLYAGFGNKDKDVYAYVAAGIEPRHTFLIDPASTIQICPECALRARPPPTHHPARRRRRATRRRRRARGVLLGVAAARRGALPAALLRRRARAGRRPLRRHRRAAPAERLRRRRARRSSAPPPRRRPELAAPRARPRSRRYRFRTPNFPCAL